MSDFSEEDIEDEEEGGPLPDVHIMTIMLDADSYSPIIDLGDIPPHAAIAFFRQAAATLESILHPPKITYDDTVIFQVRDD